MSTVERITSLEAAFEPIEVLKGEQAHLEQWVNESFQALEKLHGELADWQSELARKQTELDLREDSLDRSNAKEPELREMLNQSNAALATAKEENRQLLEENAEQLQALEELERRLAELELKLKTSQDRASALTQELSLERDNSDQAQAEWREEFDQMRTLLEQQYSLMSTFIEHSDSERLQSYSELLGNDVGSRSAELRRRAEARRTKQDTSPKNLETEEEEAADEQA